MGGEFAVVTLIHPTLPPHIHYLVYVGSAPLVFLLLLLIYVYVYSQLYVVERIRFCSSALNTVLCLCMFFFFALTQQYELYHNLIAFLFQSSAPSFSSLFYHFFYGFRQLTHIAVASGDKFTMAICNHNLAEYPHSYKFTAVGDDMGLSLYVIIPHDFFQVKKGTNNLHIVQIKNKLMKDKGQVHVVRCITRWH